MHCFTNAIPEMNHNEIAGYDLANKELAVIFLRNKNDNRRIQYRFELCRQQIKNKVSFETEIFSKGNSFTEQMFYLIHFGDWMSFYLAQQRQVDADKIEMIDWLKIQLTKNKPDFTYSALIK